MSKNKNKKQIQQNHQGLIDRQDSIRVFVDKIEPYWKLILWTAAVAGLFFRIGVWVGEHNKLDEISKIRSEYTEKIVTLSIELANQDRRPIIYNQIDSIQNEPK